MNSNNLFIKWLIELVHRLGAKSPKFFTALKWVGGLAAAITGIPEFLSMIGVVLPEPFASLATKTVAICGLFVMFISMLPVEQEEMTETKKAEVLPYTTEKKNESPN